MNIKSLLLGSAAALVAVSGARAADAIVAAEPEPMEYVRVCDAFGTGYFYIPGTETCLKIGGFLRFQTSFGPNEVNGRQGWGNAGTSDWDAFSRAYISLSAKSDTEYGTLTGFFAAEFNADNDTDEGDSRIDVDEAYIQLGGLKAGKFDAIMAVPEWQWAAEGEGFGKTIYDVQDAPAWDRVFGGPIPVTVGYVLKETVERSPDLVQAYVTATVMRVETTASGSSLVLSNGLSLPSSAVRAVMQG